VTDPIELRCGDWRDALADVDRVDALITDPPYSARTDSGYRSAKDYDAERLRRHVRGTRSRNGRQVEGAMPRGRFELQYRPIDRAWVEEACAFFVPRVRCWFVIFGDHISARWWEECLTAHGCVTFAPVPWIRIDAPPRFAADGPANACEWITIARPKGMPLERGSRRGWYEGSIQDQKLVTGGKPLWLMRALIRDYTRAGDLVCDPCAGGGTTLLAAAIEGRRAVGAELDPHTHALACKRIARGYTPDLFASGPGAGAANGGAGSGSTHRAEQVDLFGAGAADGGDPSASSTTKGI
jgi:site-specific DNA-methyltransferase (adenine-specific)